MLSAQPVESPRQYLHILAGKEKVSETFSKFDSRNHVRSDQNNNISFKPGTGKLHSPPLARSLLTTSAKQNTLLKLKSGKIKHYKQFPNCITFAVSFSGPFNRNFAIKKQSSETRSQTLLDLVRETFQTLSRYFRGFLLPGVIFSS